MNTVKRQSPHQSARPLQGLRVLELGQLIAAPFCGCMLGSFGAEVIKVEPPKGGDPMRTWRKIYGPTNTSLWWYSIARNKKSITLDLHHPDGPDLLRKLVAKDIDILIENFRPGRMEKWGLSFEELQKINPRLIMVRLSGFGQTGPYRERPGFASVAEGMGGIRYVTGEPERPPVRTGVSLGDTLAGLHAALGALTAVYHRDAHGGIGQVVDVAISESVLNMMESLIPEYDVLGYVRERVGSRLGGIVPSNTYRCKDGKYIIIGGNNDSIFKRFMNAIGREDLANDPRLAQNPGRVEHEELIDSAISAFTIERDFSDVFQVLDKADVPVGPISSAADILADPQFQARGMFESHQLPDGKSFQIPKIVPHLASTPAETEWIGPELGSHNAEIYGKLLGLSQADIENLKAQHVI